MVSCVYVCIIIPIVAIVKPIQNDATINMVNKSRKIPKNLQSIKKSHPFIEKSEEGNKERNKNRKK